MNTPTPLTQAFTIATPATDHADPAQLEQQWRQRVTENGGTAVTEPRVGTVTAHGLTFHHTTGLIQRRVDSDPQ